MKLVTNRIHLSAPKTSLEDLLKKASSTNQVKTASAKKAVKTASSEGVKTASEKEEDCGCPEGVDPKAKKDDKNKKEDGKACEATAKKNVKVADDKGVVTTDTGKLEAKNFTNDAKKEPEDETVHHDKKPKTKKDGEEVTSGQPQWEGKQENNNKPEVVASVNDRIIKGIPTGKWINVNANLKPEVKNKVKAYWRKLYGEDYANAMVADK